MNIKTYDAEVVAGALVSVIRNHGFKQEMTTVEEIWSEVCQYNTYGDETKLWVSSIRKWERDSEATGERAYYKVKNIIKKKWKERARLDKEIEFMESMKRR